MGRGDRRTKKGKIFRGTFGNTRPRDKKKKSKSDSKQKIAGPKK